MNSKTKQIQEYLQNKVGLWSSTTVSSERSRVRVLLQMGFPDIDPRELYAALSERYKRYTVKQFFIRASQLGISLFKDTKYQDFMNENPEAFRGVYIGRQVALSAEDVAKFETQITTFNNGIWNAYILMRYAGLRKSEALRLQWSDINSASESLTVKQGKGFKDRVVPFTRDAQSRLRSTACNFVCSRAFTPVSNLDRYFSTASVRAGVRVTPHSLRAFALQNLSQVLSITELRDFAGHSNFQTTLKYLVPDKVQVLGKIRKARQ